MCVCVCVCKENITTVLLNNSISPSLLGLPPSLPCFLPFPVSVSLSCFLNWWLRTELKKGEEEKKKSSPPLFFFDVRTQSSRRVKKQVVWGERRVSVCELRGGGRNPSPPHCVRCVWERKKDIPTTALPSSSGQITTRTPRFPTNTFFFLNSDNAIYCEAVCVWTTLFFFFFEVEEKIRH